MVDNMVVIREFKGERDIEMVGKLERNCEIRCRDKEVSVFANMIGGPLRRIRFYPLHVMLVAELRENGELVGVVRGCVKRLGTKFGGTHVNFGCILGLRVSPSHRRMGIGLKLMKSVEEWMTRNGAHYTFLATEKNNVASTTLFTTKCNYLNLSSLVIFVQPVNSFPVKALSDQDIKIEKLDIDQAISLYNNKLRSKDIYPTDMDSILKEKLSLGTWLFYFKEEEWPINGNSNLQNREKINIKDIIISGRRTSSSWAMFSIWNSCETYKYKFRIRKSHHPLKLFHATLSQARDKIFPCLKMPLEKLPFVFLFLYGIHGEGERVSELLKSAWSFASRLAENVKDCKVIMTELGVSDPLIQHLPQESSVSCINDLWYIKELNINLTGQKNDLRVMGEAGNVFIDPRDF